MNPEELIVPSLGVMTVIYALGAARVWKTAGLDRGLKLWQASAFLTGIVVTGLALAGRVDALVDEFFAAHMIQHMILIFISAPLFVLSGVPQAFFWALGGRASHRLAHFWGRQKRLRRAWEWLSGVWPAWALFTFDLWIWHAPPLYQAAVESNLVHAVEHLGFLFTAMLFWWTILAEFRSRVRGGAGLLALIFAMLQMGLLGALIALSPGVIYPDYHGGVLLGMQLTALGDQQLAGLVMWLPGGIIFLFLIAGYGMLWLEKLENDNPA